MSEDRIELMDLFRRDMTGIEPTRAWPEEENPHPAFKNHPEVFKFEQSTYLFKVWRAGRDALAAQRDEGLAWEAELRNDNVKLVADRARLSTELENLRSAYRNVLGQLDASQQRLAGTLEELRKQDDLLSEAYRYDIGTVLKRKIRKSSPGCADGEKS